MSDAEDLEDDEEERSALVRSLNRGRESAVELVEDAIRDIRRQYAPAFAARVVPKLQRAVDLMRREGG